MTVAIDYDGTWTVDPPMWERFVALLRDYGHSAVIVTMRPQGYPIVCDADLPIIYTNGNRKRPYAQARGIRPDVWIDDQPELIP